MTFDEAIKEMIKGNQVRRKDKWLTRDYIFIYDNIIYDDGGNPYLKNLTVEDLNSSDWIISKSKSGITHKDMEQDSSYDEVFDILLLDILLESLEDL